MSDSVQKQAELAQTLRWYEDNAFTDPETRQRFSGRFAEERLTIELGRKLVDLKTMRNQPSLMNDDD